MANRRNLQNLINQRLKSDAKKEALENLENNDIELVREQLETKRNTTIGTDFVEGSIESEFFSLTQNRLVPDLVFRLVED